MALYECQTCGGQYQDVLPDGLLYFHACAPLSVAEGAQGQERPDRRDENVVSEGGPEQGTERLRGKGRLLVPKRALWR